MQITLHIPLFAITYQFFSTRLKQSKLPRLPSMESSSRSVFLLGLLVASFCVTASAGRELTETNKLGLGGLNVDKLLDDILKGLNGDIGLAITVDLEKVLGPIVLTLEDAVGGAVDLDAVAGAVTELKGPITVKVNVDGTVVILVEALGKKVRVPVKLSALDPVLETVGNIVHVVLTLVENVVDGVHVVEILDPVGKILASIVGAL